MCTHASMDFQLSRAGPQEFTAPMHLSSLTLLSSSQACSSFLQSVCLFVLLVIGIKGWSLTGDLGFKCILPGCLLSLRVKLTLLCGPPQLPHQKWQREQEMPRPIVDISLSFSLCLQSLLLLKDSQHQHLEEWCGEEGGRWEQS